MKVIITMAGKGERFSRAGYGVPKILTGVSGKPMFAHAISSLKGAGYENFIFICLREHCEKFGLEEKLMEFTGGKGRVVSIPEPTRGQAETALMAGGLVREDEDILIYNADSVFRSPILGLIKKGRGKIDGMITLFESNDPSLSYARIERGRIVEVAEKKVISGYATVGAYYFGSWRMFSSYAGGMISANERTRDEFYIAPIYQKMIRDGKVVLPDYADYFADLGTPEKLEGYKPQKRQLRSRE